jgi:hypothetical protein
MNWRTTRRPARRTRARNNIRAASPALSARRTPRSPRGPHRAPSLRLHRAILRFKRHRPHPPSSGRRGLLPSAVAALQPTSERPLYRSRPVVSARGRVSLSRSEVTAHAPFPTAGPGHGHGPGFSDRRRSG